MIKKVNTLLKSQEICEIYTNVENTNKFEVGFIIGYDDHYFVAESIDQYGKNDGIFCSLAQNIIKLQVSTKYLSSISKLANYYKQTRYPSLKFEQDLMYNFVSMVREKHKICTIEMCDSNLNDVVGFIKDINKTSSTIEMQIINLNGEQDGEAIVDLKMISHISCDSLDDIKVQILSQL